MRAALATAVFLLSSTAFAGWDDCDNHSDREGRYCEARELELAAALSELAIDAAPNGGIRVEGWDRSEVRVVAYVQTDARTDRAAEDMARAISIETDGLIRARGPETGWREGWSVSYRAWVPHAFDLDLESTNGGISVDEVSGRISLDTRNGGLSVSSLGGDVRGRTSNGGLRVRLAGERWEGNGLDLRTTNGGVVLEIPDPYHADLETRTTNGGLRAEFPILFRGELRHGFHLELGEGGAPIRVVTTNGGVTLKRP